MAATGLGALGDFTDDWPVDPDALGQFANELNWYNGMGCVRTSARLDIAAGD